MQRAINENATQYPNTNDLTGDQYKFVGFTGGTLVVAGAGEPVVGVLYEAPKAGTDGTVIEAGRPQVYVGVGGITLGDEVASDALGNAVVAVAGDYILGTAMSNTTEGHWGTVDLLKTAQAIKA